MQPFQPSNAARALAAQGMRNPNFGTKGLDSYKWDDRKGLPTLENCDLSKPTERFLWALVALPGVNGGQLVMPIAYNMVVSEHLCEVGVMLKCPECGHSEPAVKKYQEPSADEGHWMTAPGNWVPLDAPERPKHSARSVLERLSSIQKGQLLDGLLEELDDDAAASRLLSKLTDKQKQQVRDLLDQQPTEE